MFCSLILLCTSCISISASKSIFLFTYYVYDMLYVSHAFISKWFISHMHIFFIFGLLIFGIVVPLIFGLLIFHEFISHINYGSGLYPSQIPRPRNVVFGPNSLQSKAWVFHLVLDYLRFKAWGSPARGSPPLNQSLPLVNQSPPLNQSLPLDQFTFNQFPRSFPQFGYSCCENKFKLLARG